MRYFQFPIDGSGLKANGPRLNTNLGKEHQWREIGINLVFMQGEKVNVSIFFFNFTC